MAQKKTKAQKAADKAFIDKIKTVGLNLGSGGVKVVESDGPPVCDGCGSELVPDGDPIGFMALPMKGKLTTSTRPAPARVRPIRRRSRWRGVSPRPEGAGGSTDGTWA